MKEHNPEPANRLVQVAAELHRLADAIGAGKVQVSGVDLTISDSISLKVKQKMTGSKVVFDIKIQALLTSEETRSSKKMGRKVKISKGTKRPYGVKALKKKYTGLWRVITSAIKKGEQPDPAAITDLAMVSKEYGTIAPPEWANLWKDNELLVGKCISSAQANDYTTANELLREINKAKKSCHKAYK